MRAGELLHDGATLASATCSVRVLVVAVGMATELPRCGGTFMVAGRPVPCTLAGRSAKQLGGTRAGQRYLDPASGLLLLCTWPGSGVLTYRGRLMPAVA
jgi:hypothetical protein